MLCPNTIGNSYKINKDAAWYYPDSKEAAKQLKENVAFGKGVEVA